MAELVWSYEPRSRRAAPKAMREIPALTPESTAMSKELSKHGFRFVGPTTVYAAMQSLGVVNDHLARCYCRALCKTEREAFTPPSG